MYQSLPSFIYPTHVVNKSGDHFIDITSTENWASNSSNNYISQNHPILTPALLFVSKVFSQAKFDVKNKKSKKVKNNHPYSKLLNNPNPFQTRNDFLESLIFSMIANGVCIILKKYVIGEDWPENLYLLDPDRIDWPDDIKTTKFTVHKTIKDLYGDKEVDYRDEDGEIIKFKIRDLLFFYDLPNFLNPNPFKVKSRLDGFKQTLINTQDSLVAKNIILKSNGKELITRNSKSKFPLTDDDKEDAETLFNVGYGLNPNRKRGLITSADLTWKSLHIALRDLGLDESTKVDGNIIYTGLHIPKDIMSLEAKKTTYNNFKESMVSYLQNEAQGTLNSVLSVFQKDIHDNNNKTNICIEGNYEHLPIMQYVLIERYDGLIKKGRALQELRKSGLPDEVCLEECGFDGSISLKNVSNGKKSDKSRKTKNKKNK